MIKQYIRDAAPRYSSDANGNAYQLQGRPRKIGVMVSTGPGKMGFSLISPEENLNDCRPTQRDISITRNGKQETLTIHGREKIWSGPKIWEFGTNLALERAEGRDKNPTEISRSVKRQIERFRNRMERTYNKESV